MAGRRRRHRQPQARRLRGRGRRDRSSDRAARAAGRLPRRQVGGLRPARRDRLRRVRALRRARQQRRACHRCTTDLPSVTQELYDKVHAVNASGPFRLSALIGTRMAEGDGGSIINVSTAGSWRPDATDLPYAMAKAGLNAMTLGARRRLGAQGAGQPRAARRVRHRHHRRLVAGSQGARRRAEPDEAHRRAGGHGGAVRVPGE